jgi:hypothetical protein
VKQVEVLLDRYLERVASTCDDDERELFYLALESLAPGELFAVVTENVAALLRDHVASPASLVLTLN